MKKLRKVLKGIVSDAVAVVVVLVILLLLVIFYGKGPAPEELIVRIFLYLIFAGMFLAAMGIYLLVVFLQYRQGKAVLRGIPGFSEARFEREAERGPQFVQMVAVSDAICYAGIDHITHIIPMTDIIWVYQPESVNGLWIYTRDRDLHKINVRIKGKGAAKNGEKGARYLMRLIARKNKNVLLGYNPSYEELYRHDFAGLCRLAQGREIVDSAWLEREYIENDYYHKDFQ